MARTWLSIGVELVEGHGVVAVVARALKLILELQV